MTRPDLIRTAREAIAVQRPLHWRHAAGLVSALTAPAGLRCGVLESPLAGLPADAARAYALDLLRAAVARGVAPIASHVLLALSGALDDTDPAQRAAGMRAGFAWGLRADVVIVGADYGISGGMREGIAVYQDAGIPVEVWKILEPGPEQGTLPL